MKNLTSLIIKVLLAISMTTSIVAASNNVNEDVVDVSLGDDSDSLDGGNGGSFDSCDIEDFSCDINIELSDEINKALLFLFFHLNNRENFL
jgi:hypothetical protein